MKAADQFHAGIVTDDPESTMAELTDLFGYEWCEAIGGSSTVELPSGPTEIDLQVWYSMSTPRLEVVRSIPDSAVWTPATGSGVHHLGYWCDDVAAASAELVKRGYATEATGKRDGVAYWAYHRSPIGPRVELVSRALQPMVEQYFATGKAGA